MTCISFVKGLKGCQEPQSFYLQHRESWCCKPPLEGAEARGGPFFASLCGAPAPGIQLWDLSAQAAGRKELELVLIGLVPTNHWAGGAVASSSTPNIPAIAVKPKCTSPAVLSHKPRCQLAGSTLSCTAPLPYQPASLFPFFFFSSTLVSLHDGSVSCCGLDFNKSNQTRLWMCHSSHTLLSCRAQHHKRSLAVAPTLHFQKSGLFLSKSLFL